MQLLQRDTEQSRVREKPSDPALPVTLRPHECARGDPQPPKCPVLTNCWTKSSGPSAAFPAGSRAAPGVAAVEQAKHPSNPLLPRQMLRQRAARMPRDTSPAVFLCLLTITAAHFNCALQFFAYNPFFFPPLRVYFYCSYIEFHLPFHLAHPNTQVTVPDSSRCFRLSPYFCIT